MADSFEQIPDVSSPSYLHPEYGNAVVDNLLHVAAREHPDFLDLLLDLKFTLNQRVDATETLRLFCIARRELEEVFYLRLYRLRRWLEAQIAAEVTWPRGYRMLIRPVKLSERSLEDLSRGLLARAAESRPEVMGGAGKISFHFLPLSLHQMAPALRG